LNSHHTVLAIAYQYGVESSLVDSSVKGCLGEIHSLDVHHQIFKIFRFVFVLFLHGLYANVGNVDIGDTGIAFLEHFLAEAGVAGTNIEDSTGLIDMRGEDVLESTEALIPVERFWISR
jgi:hypothetical protein